ncbi:AfsR/SARP family transcriptional regulator [Fimbriimonas ginsengisoli]|uniref:Transcriptional activator n=1 Tax=Fimbriimonas ginsengisoli Gsoil 348 TaxID=661478 RepID=A0A068NSE2_FIMGI|nr:BTAD domain-containing putative transcriptional regulator [Fimbriimonas ginsengisoli]AIE86361.1 transcriptional activator [Fimbriimonas ginsengisoli Gsoil 348]
MAKVWQIEMLGALRVTGQDVSIDRFRTRRVALLLAYLACYRNRVHFRDEVGELLWPETDPVAIGRNLRQALTSLRHVVEPPPLPPGSILQVQQARLRLNPELVSTDVGEFEQSISEARRKGDAPERIPLLRRAIDLYKGEFLPGYSEDWVTQERLRLDDLYVYSLRKLIDHCKQTKNPEESVYYLRLALEKERLNEELHVCLMEEYLASGRPASAIQQFEDLRRQLEDHLGEEPGQAAFDLYEKAQRTTDPSVQTPTRRAAPNPPPRLQPEIEEEGAPAPTVRLPVHLTRFCGRQEEVAYTLDHLLYRDVRLTTLLGPAGTGKTRLAAEVGRRLAETGEWNVWFVPLADVSDGSTVMDAIFELLKARGAGNQDPLDRLRNTLHGRQNNLLILDNLEHIVEDAAPVIDRIAQKVPEVRLLVTSRQSLRLSVEHQIPVPPLPVPPSISAPEDLTELARLAECPSVQLFVDRCQAIRPDFQLTTHNSRAIAAICGKLEGVPLAIELAAGLSGSFPPSQMVYHLQKRLTALTSRRRDLPARHRSLRAAIDYSYETLPAALQRFFASLSVFRGGFKVEAAYEVCFRDRFEPACEDASMRTVPLDDCLNLLIELQERSLLRTEEADEECELSFRMLESFREYAEEHLSEAEHHDLCAQHGEFYRRQPPKTTFALSAEERTKRHLWIESEYENYIAAIDFYFREQAFEPCIELLEILATTWASRGPRGAERSYIRRIANRLEGETIDPARHILLLRMLGTTHIRSLEYAAAHQICIKALAIAERHALSDQIAVCHTAIATCAGYLGNLDECLVLSEKVLATVPEENLLQRERAYLGIGAVHWGRGALDEANRAFQRAADISAKRLGGDPEALILSNLARVSLDTGRLDEAMTRLGETMRICGRLHDDFGMATCLSLVSRYHWLKRDLAAAVATGFEALTKFRQADFSHYSLVGIFQQALILVDIEEWEVAATLLATTQGIGRAARLPDEWDHAAAIGKIRLHLGAAEFERAWARGLAMDTEEAFRLALRFK